MSYKFCRSGEDSGRVLIKDAVLRLSDHAIIPFDDNNVDYQEYTTFLYLR